MSPDTAVQKALVDTWINDPAVTALVVPQRIRATAGLPEAPYPLVVVGQDEVYPQSSLSRRHFSVVTTTHVWAQSIAEAKEIGSALVESIWKLSDTSRRGLSPVAGAYLYEPQFQSARYFPDPSGKLAHGVVTLETVVEMRP